MIPKPTIVQKKQKSLIIKILPDNTVSVSAPKSMPRWAIENWIQTKEDWLLKQFNKNKDQLEHKHRLQDDGLFLYLGDTLSYEQMGVDRAGIDTWYQARAKDIFEDRLAIALTRGLPEPTKLSIRSMRSRWGSCAPNTGHISLNLSLIKTPIDVIDYVIIHELCHLIHPNHSFNFWALVQHHCSEYRTHKQWLKNHTFLII